MTPYRDRLLAGHYDVKQPPKQTKAKSASKTATTGDKATETGSLPFKADK